MTTGTVELPRVLRTEPAKTYRAFVDAAVLAEWLPPCELIRYTDRFDDANLPGELQVTVKLKPVLIDTEVRITQSGIPAVIPVEMCYLGWQESLTQLATLVEPNIPG